jgi:hypothetical protein
MHCNKAMEIEMRTCQTLNVYYLERTILARSPNFSPLTSGYSTFIEGHGQPAPRIRQHSYMLLLILDLCIQFYFIFVFTFIIADELLIPLLPIVQLFFSLVRMQVDFVLVVFSSWEQNTL